MFSYDFIVLFYSTSFLILFSLILLNCFILKSDYNYDLLDFISWSVAVKHFK